MGSCCDPCTARSRSLYQGALWRSPTCYVSLRIGTLKGTVSENTLEYKGGETTRHVDRHISLSSVSSNPDAFHRSGQPFGTSGFGV